MTSRTVRNLLGDRFHLSGTINVSELDPAAIDEDTIRRARARISLGHRQRRSRYLMLLRYRGGIGGYSAADNVRFARDGRCPSLYLPSFINHAGAIPRRLAPARPATSLRRRARVTLVAPLEHHRNHEYHRVLRDERHGVAIPRAETRLRCSLTVVLGAPPALECYSAERSRSVRACVCTYVRARELVL